MRGLKGALLGIVLLALVVVAVLLFGERALEKPSPPNAPDSAAPADGSEEPADVRGHAAFADGWPAEGARVQVLWKDAAGNPGRSSAVTDGRGMFTIADLRASAPMGVGVPEKLTEVQVTLGPLSAKIAASDLSGGGAPGVHVTPRFAETFRIAGLVQHIALRTAVAGARVGCAGASVVADDAGAFRLDGIPATALRDTELAVTVTADAYRPLTWKVPRHWLPPRYDDVLLLMEPAE